MKRVLIILLSLFAIMSLWSESIFTGKTLGSVIKAPNRTEFTAWQETFETGANGWTHSIGGNSPYNWHVFYAGTPQGDAWWMGDPTLASGSNIGGYHDGQYLVLDTPQVLLPNTNPTLTFKLKYNMEALGGDYPAGYNGWDSGNVRISTNNGQTWIPISGFPAYNITSASSFGIQHGEGTNIPGWGGSSNGWQNASFNLSAYAGQNVKVRFAFASDASTSTSTYPAMFGMMVDDIVVGAYANYGANDGQMTWTSLVPMAGDLWHVATVPNAPSPTHAMLCQNTQGSYNTNMMNYLVSPPVTLPATGDLRADFMLKASFSDPDDFPECDYFGWEISGNNGASWYPMSNPTGAAGGSNYVYATETEDWTTMYNYTGISFYFSSYAGTTVKFRWYFHSDGDTPLGSGLMIDDFRIYNDIVVAPPENLQAVLNGTNVSLTWQEPGTGGGVEPGWIGYDGENNPDGGVGLTGGGTFQVAAKWNPTGEHSIADWVGMNITQVKFFVHEAGLTYKVRIYTGASGTMAYEQIATNIIANAWNTVTLTTPFSIPGGTYVWVGYQILNPLSGQFPAGMDNGPAIVGFGDMITTGGSWTSVYTSSNASIDANWSIEAYVTDTNGNPVLISRQANSRTDRDVTAYRVYRDASQIAELAPTQTQYTDSNVTSGLHTYHVTAMYGTIESFESNIVSVFTLPADYAELSYDDGTFETGFSVGSTRSMGVKFSNSYVTTLRYVKIFVQVVGTSPLFVRIYDDDGTNGLPGTLLLQFTYPSVSIVSGWNLIPMPAGNEIVIPDGQFYIVVLEFTNASLIGMDTSSNGRSYKKLSSTTGWQPITEGELMMRAIVENGLPTVTINVTGLVVGSDVPNTGLSNAHVALNGVVDYNGVTNLQGQFQIPGVMANSTYTFTISKPGYQSMTGSISVSIEDYSFSIVMLNELLTPPSGFLAQEIFTFTEVNLFWTPPVTEFARITRMSLGSNSLKSCESDSPSGTLNSRNLQGYRIWRLQPGQEDNPTSWVQLSTTDITSTSFVDSGWVACLDGQYKWAIKAVYTFNLISAAVFSNVVIKNSQVGTLTGTVCSIYNIPIANAIISAGSYSVGTDANGAYSMLLHAGTQTVTCNATGFLPQNQSNVIITNGHTTTADFYLATTTEFADSFDSYPDFALEFAPWVNMDLDMSATYGISGSQWQNANSAQAFIVFNPSATIPPTTNEVGIPHSGAKMATCWADVNPANDDWLISPIVNVSTGAYFSFYARSLTELYGLERIKVGYSIGGTAAENFITLSGTPYISIPTTWTQYTFSIPTGVLGNIRIGIHCISNDAYCLQIDDFAFTFTSPITINVSGVVVGSDALSTGLVNASINLVGDNSYSGVTNALGQFNLSGVISNQIYTYTISKEGYQNATGSISVGLVDYSLDTTVLFESLIPVEIVQATENTDHTEVNIDWIEPGLSNRNKVLTGIADNRASAQLQQSILSVGMSSHSRNPVFSTGQSSGNQNPSSVITSIQGERTLLGYKVWRLLSGQEFDESTWILLTPDNTTGTEVIDTSWSQIGVGNYRWAVKTIYTNNLMSIPAFSNVVTKTTTIGILSGTVRNIGNNLVIGATISAGGFTTNTDNNGVFSLQLPVGSYSVACTATNYHTQTQNNMVIVAGQTTTLDFNLTPVASQDGLAVTATVLKGNFPNPFRSSTSICYGVKDREFVRIDIFNSKGQLIRTLVNEIKNNGAYSTIWDCKDKNGIVVANGVYNYRLLTKAYSSTQRMLLLK